LTKEKLSIGLFGEKKFYIGLIVGLLFTISIYLFFAYFREILRGQSFHSDLITPTRGEFIIYNFFFAASSVTIGFGITIWLWFHGFFKSKRTRLKINYISAYALFWSMTLLYVISKSGTKMTFILFAGDGYDNHLNLAKEFPLLLFLLPTVFFLNIWTPIRLSYRSGNWLVKSLGAFIVLTTLLAFILPIDQTRLNLSWDKYMAPYNQIVDNEIKRANSKGITFSNQAIETIRFNKKERVLRQANNLKNRFKSKTPIPTDSVVLELILVKKTTIRVSYNSKSENEAELWPFALPRHIYRQIQLTDDSIKIAYLKEILQEYDSIFKTEWDFMEDNGLSDRESTRSSLSHWYGETAFELLYFNDKLKKEKGK
jgi:hypothetical protein